MKYATFISGWCIDHNRDYTGGEAKILTKKGITFPPVDIVEIHSGLMIQCQILTGGGVKWKKNIDLKRDNIPPG